jgi:hypothetical protein
LKNEIYGTPISSSSPEPTRIRDTDNSAEAKKWNSYASTASSPTPAPTNRWTNDRYQSEPSTPPTNNKWVNDMYSPSDKPSSTSRWASNSTLTGQSASANDRHQSEPSMPPTNRKWVNDMYDPSDKPSSSSRRADNPSTGQSTPTGRRTHDRYDPSEQAERSGNDKKSTWRIDISSTSSGDSTPTKWSQAGLHAENLPKNDGPDSPKQANAPGDGNSNSELKLEQPVNDSGRSTPQTNDAPAEHEAAGSQWSKYKTDSSASVNNPNREKEAPTTQETAGSQWNNYSNDSSASFNNRNRENDLPAKQETAGSQWNNYSTDSSASVNNPNRENDPPAKHEAAGSQWSKYKTDSSASVNRENDSPAKQDTAGSQWSKYNTDSSTSFNNRNQSRENTTRNHNNDKRGFNNSDDKAFEQLKNEIYGTSTSTSTSASASRMDDRNNQVNNHWEKDENDQWVPFGARDEATSDDTLTNSKWSKGNEGDCPPEITDKDAYMVKISNPEEGTHYWVKAYKPCLAMNSNWGDVFSTVSPAAPSPPSDSAASKWAQWAQKSS